MLVLNVFLLQELTFERNIWLKVYVIITLSVSADKQENTCIQRCFNHMGS